MSLTRRAFFTSPLAALAPTPAARPRALTSLEPECPCCAMRFRLPDAFFDTRRSWRDEDIKAGLTQLYPVKCDLCGWEGEAQFLKEQT